MKLIGVASGWGAQRHGTENGPQVLKDADVIGALREVGVDIEWGGTVHPSATAAALSLDNPADALPLVCEVNRRLGSILQSALQQAHFPVVIGGDHAIAAGTWPAVVSHYGAGENFGLIWVDAHLDAHTSITTPSGAYHGMPVAALMGEGTAEFVTTLKGGATLRPEHICIVGVRSWEEEEWQFLQKRGVRVIFMEEIKRIGVAAAMKEALTIATHNTAGFGVSVDLDAFDPEIAPGVGSPEPDGLDFEEMKASFERLSQHPLLKAIEIVEYNPERDQDGKTLSLLKESLRVLLSTR